VDHTASKAAAEFSTPFRGRVENAVKRLFDVLVDPARQDRAMLGVFACYVAVWTLYGVVQQSSQDIHPDMAELFNWSQQLALGCRDGRNSRCDLCLQRGV
jgi:hypothetical protein